MSSLENLDRMMAYIHSGAVRAPDVADMHNLARAIDIEHREVMAACVREVRHNVVAEMREHDVEPLKAENAKLRELIADAHEALRADKAGWDAATTDSMTCTNVHEPPKDTTFWPTPHFKCSVCGCTHVSTDYVFYCPNCGRQVVDE